MKTLSQRPDGSVGLIGQGTFVAYQFLPVGFAAEAADAIDVTFQLCDGQGNPIKVAGLIGVFAVTGDVPGDLTLGTALTSLTVQTGALVWVQTTGSVVLAATDANGRVVLRGTIAGANVRRLSATPWGTLGGPTQTGTITWAA